MPFNDQGKNQKHQKIRYNYIIDKVVLVIRVSFRILMPINKCFIVNTIVLSLMKQLLLTAIFLHISTMAYSKESLHRSPNKGDDMVYFDESLKPITKAEAEELVINYGSDAKVHGIVLHAVPHTLLEKHLVKIKTQLSEKRVLPFHFYQFTPPSPPQIIVFPVEIIPHDVYSEICPYCRETFGEIAKGEKEPKYYKSSQCSHVACLTCIKSAIDMTFDDDNGYCSYLSSGLEN